jgi:hypothetical protein
MAVLVLLLVILTFGFSIATRYAGDDPDPYRNVSDGAEFAPPTVDPPEDRPVPAVARDRVQLIVENGCGVNGFARDFAEAIRGPHFDVVDYRDADRYDYTETTILTTEQGRQAAQRLLQELQERYRVGEIQLIMEPIYAADVRLILGADLADSWDRRPDVP